MKKQNIKKILIRLLKKFDYTFISRYIDGKIKWNQMTDYQVFNLVRAKRSHTKIAFPLFL